MKHPWTNDRYRLELRILDLSWINELSKETNLVLTRQIHVLEDILTMKWLIESNCCSLSVYNLRQLGHPIFKSILICSSTTIQWNVVADCIPSLLKIFIDAFLSLVRTGAFLQTRARCNERSPWPHLRFSLVSLIKIYKPCA